MSGWKGWGGWGVGLGRPGETGCGRVGSEPGGMVTLGSRSWGGDGSFAEEERPGNPSHPNMENERVPILSFLSGITEFKNPGHKWPATVADSTPEVKQ